MREEKNLTLTIINWETHLFFVVGLKSLTVFSTVFDLLNVNKSDNDFILLSN